MNMSFPFSAPQRWLVTLTYLLVLLFSLPSLAAQQSSDSALRDGYVGSEQCRTCHSDEFQNWQGSDHKRAMQHATPDTVLGRFDGSELQYSDTTYQFFQRDNQFYINADGPDGSPTEYRVLYTFGVDPLQQYLVELDGGRLQALPVAWDSRTESAGGQRWFHLYPDQAIDYKDALHWTGLNQNWNFMCADCHSTNLNKGYDPQADSFNTTWSEISVGCEACHGPAQKHLKWAEQADHNNKSDKGLQIQLNSATSAKWTLQPGSNTATRSQTPDEENRLAHKQETETCARCHSRRLTLAEDQPGAQLEDSRAVQLLGQNLYHSDGQIKDEVFEYGSFIQSRMYHEGVTCSTCHDPHSAKLRAPKEQVCALCHLSETYDSPQHSFHPASSSSTNAGQSTASTVSKKPDCLDCHMPAKNYMVVDPRRDHSLRVPRPDLSVTLGTPNACRNCHQKQTDQWAATAVKSWLGRDARGLQSYAEALHAGRSGALAAEQGLISLIENPQQPAIARASALQLLPSYLSQTSFPVLVSALKDDNAMIRKAALSAAESLSGGDRLVLLPPLLSDPLKGVRIEAARLLAAIPAEQLPAADRQRHTQALEEFRQAQLFNAERPESHLNLGNLLRQQNKLNEAEQAYRKAILLDNRFSPAWANLADLYRQRGDEEKATAILQEGLGTIPNDAGLLMAQGFAKIRQQQATQAQKSFAAAMAAAPENPRYRYIYGVALRSNGQKQAGLQQLEKARALFPANAEVLRALLDATLRDQQLQKALQYATDLHQISPPDPQLEQMIQRLKQDLNLH